LPSCSAIVQDIFSIPFAMICALEPISPMKAGMELNGSPCANTAGLFLKADDQPSQPSADDDTESVHSMDMSTNDDSCSELSVDDSSSDEYSSLDDSPFTTEQTLMIFDWDDTILPSTWVQKQGLRLDEASHVSAEQREQLDSMAQVAIRTLRAAKKLGTVVLVTNAERGWIELSSRKFMPSICPLLESFKIVSARALFEKPGVTLPSMWKSLAFRDEINMHYQSLAEDWTRNVISFGDAMHERLAVFQVTSDMSNTFTKSFKFMEQPHLEQLRKEHELIFWCLRHIVSHSGTLDLQVQIA